MIWLRSSAFHVAFWLWTLGLGLLGLPALLKKQWVTRLASLWVNGALVLLRRCCKLDIEVRGLNHLSHSPAIYAVKHQSTLDTLILWKLLGGPAFVLKKQLFLVPVFGWYLARCEPIAIIRSLGSKMLPKIMEQAQACLAGGRHIVIFPEGTRRTPGAPAAYKMAGISVMYESTTAIVIPVALNTGLFWPKRQFTKRAGHAVVELLPPLPAGLAREELARMLPERIEAATARLVERSAPVGSA